MIVAVLQARLGSSRLPGKVLLNLCGKTVLAKVIERVKRSKLVNKIVVATTINNEDDAIKLECDKLNVSCVRGSQNDVLDRFNMVANASDAIHIVRITCDCPLIDPEIIDMVIEKHLAEKNDLTTNSLSETFPDGLDCEVIERNVLFDAWKNAKLKSDREHVTTFIKNNPIKYQIGELKSDVNYYHKRWTLDQKEDYEFIKAVYEKLGDNFSWIDVLRLLERHPELEKINNFIRRNEGYYISLENN